MKRLISIFCCCLSILFLAACAGTGKNVVADFEKSYSLDYKKYIGANPLKGFMDFNGGVNNGFPHSLEYLPINLETVMTGENSWDFSGVEQALTECKNRGHQGVLRFIMDCPDEVCHIPAYFFEKGVEVFEYDYGVSPDYNNEFLLEQVCNFIKALAEIYDGDSRIASIQTGVIGHWGEQHIWYVENHINFEEKWNIKASTWERFFKAWGENFTKTKLSTRNPSRPGHKNFASIGYYNDMICSADDNLYFDELMGTEFANPDSWKTSSITGEIAPGLQLKLIEAIVQKDDGAEVYKAYRGDVAKYHISSAIFANLFDGEDFFVRENQVALLTAQSLMGYDLYVKNFAIKADKSDGKLVAVTVEVGNKGVAPFPYRWDVELALFDGEKILQVVKTDWDFTGLLNEDETEVFSCSFKVDWDGNIIENSNGNCTVLMRIVNPMENGLPVRFSNSSQDTLVDGYVSLGGISRNFIY